MFKRLCSIAIVAIAVTSLSACVVVPPQGHGPRFERDRDGVPYRHDRDGDRSPNRHDRWPDDPYRR